ncbi:MAG: acyl-CoA dehydrogenase family protein [Actinomycetota bacterium]|nr:acyl-CoA dehydrogenase family protein [Actinomycetota bacterium]MEC7366680.1 acyl-CoA dehydrogenase family protein [Actinomycetota bacterium]MEC8392200.1 acyl-CoA dehydrogenase family protein [Actinomycetota bacterium]
MAIENKNRNEREDASINVAEESREMEWKSKSYMASIFLGDFDLNIPMRNGEGYPEQDPEDKLEGDKILSSIKIWADQHLDGDQIDKDESIPGHVWSGLKDLNLFAIKIPKKYGGLGMSQTNYMRILSLISRYCGSVAATLSAHQSIGVPQPIKLAGTQSQKDKWLPKFSEGWVSAFALTEPNVGSDPANMATEAHQDGDEWVINGEKLWCTNGVVADVIVVMAKTGTKVTNSGKQVNEISAFILETDTPGFEVIHRCKFMGIRAVENGLLKFTNCRVPAENLIGGRGNGLKLALSTLNDGRLSIPAIAADNIQYVSEFSARWGRTREQWGRNIGSHEPGSEKLAQIHSAGYAMSAFSDYCAYLSDEGKQDMRMEAAAAKMFNTELLWEIMDTALQLRGGRGYETSESLRARGEFDIPIERMLRDARINRIVEGTTDIMHLFLAREALDWHLSNAGPLFSRASVWTKLKTVVKCAGIYSLWAPKLLVPSFLRRFSSYHPKIRPYLRKIDARSKRLARTLFGQMLIQGPKLEMKQLTLARLVDIGTELAVCGLVASRVESEIRGGSTDNLLAADYWIRTRLDHVDSLFRDVWRNNDKAGRLLADEQMSRAPFLPEVDTSHLSGIETDKGREITNGIARK